MQTTEQKKEVFFDESGNTIDEAEAVVEDVVEESVTDSDDTGEIEQEAAPAAAETGRKFKIGNKEFATAEEALAYAENHVSTLETENQIADAYRQGLKDAIANAPAQAQSVTPEPEPQPEFNTEELYTDPQAFLSKFANKVKTETQAELDQRQAIKEQSDAIWREFTERHPNLADFRSEVESIVNENTTKVRAIIGTKGRPAAYDWISTHLMSRFERYANTLKPKRTLPNTTGGSSPTTKVSGVTQTKQTKKPLSFAEQIRSIRKRR